MKQLRNLLLTFGTCAVALLALGVVAVSRSDERPRSSPPKSQQKQAAVAKPSAEFFEEHFRPFLRQHCLACHAGEEPESDVRLDQQTTAAALREDRQRWLKVVAKMKSGQMPPPDESQPPPAQRDAMVGWLDHYLNYVDCDAPRDPGRVTIRRLNRLEYQNTVRDLLGVEFKLPDDFPADDVGYGFDNIGDVLTLPPLLMEKYLAAAEQIADEVLAQVRPAEGAKVELSAERLQSDGRVSRRGDAWYFTSSGNVFARHRFQDDGEYTIRILAEGDQAGDEPVKMALSLDGKQLKVFDIKTDGVIETLDHLMSVKAGEHRIGASFINDYYRPEARDPSQRDRNMALHGIEIIGPRRQRPADESPVAQRVFFAQPGPEDPAEEAAAKILRSVAGRAFRRPATEEEVARLTAFARHARERKKNFQESIALALQAILVSPNFLFKVEADPAPPDEQRVRRLDEYELATRLSYFLWSTMPDEELRQQARAGTLRENLQAQARRMLVDERSRALADNFATQWLGLRNLSMMQPDVQMFANFDDALRSSMYREAVLFFDDVVRQDRSILDLIDAEFTFADERLARHYGIGSVRGDRFQRVSLSGTPRGGVLTQAGVLTVTSNPTRTSPVKRGKWILENILGTPPPDPPANVPELDETREASSAASLRERLELHRQDARCAVCHRDMDELGFAMENFNAVGAWRDKDGQFEIDASGKLDTGETFRGAVELRKLLRSKYRDQFLRCFVEKLLTYAVGRGIEYYDRCTVDEICEVVQQSDYKFSAIVLEIVQSEPFQERRGKL